MLFAARYALYDIFSFNCVHRFSLHHVSISLDTLNALATSLITLYVCATRRNEFAHCAFNRAPNRVVHGHFLFYSVR